MTLDELALRYQQRYTQLRSTTAVRMAATWAVHGGLDDEAAASFSHAASELAAAATVATATLTAGYLTASRQLAAVDIEVEPVDPHTFSDGSLRGVDPLEEYRRPITTARVARSDGKPLEKAMRRGGRRAEVLALTDIALAQRAVVALSGGGPGIVGYRRVLTGKSCALCAAASTQRYKTGSLAPIHSSCDCSVAEIYGTKDPGRVINQQRLDELKARPLGDDPNYWTSRHFRITADDRIEIPGITIRDHGELGAVLTIAGHAHTGPADIAA